MPTRRLFIYHYCPWCNRVVRHKRSTLVLHDGLRSISQLERYGKGEWLEFPYHLSHNDCQPSEDEEEAGYYVGLDRFGGTRPFSTDNLEGWTRHLERKLWWDPDMAAGLAMASLLAKGSLFPKSPRQSISPKLRAQVYERDGFRCRRCGHAPPDVRLVIDHITPVASGGASDLGNLQTLCDHCNAGKQHRPPTPHDLAAGA